MDLNELAKSVLKWTALTALFLVPLTPLIVADTFFFPFITGKAFYFRIVVEIAVCAWIGLAILDAEYRPRFSWIGAAVLAFVLWMFVADLFAVNVLKAFWSNYERMEGWVLLIHLLGFFVAASCVLGRERKWGVWFFWSVCVSLLVVAYSAFQITGALAIHQSTSRVDATLGNSAYVAIYFLFNTFIAGWLALTEERQWLKWGLIAVAVIEAIMIFFTETRGTVIGLVGALTLAALLTALTAGKVARQIAAGAIIVIVVVSGTFLLAKDSSFVQNNSALRRIASISLSDLNVRLMIWDEARQGFLASPVTGYGQEGFNYVFNKYYNPNLYNQESWFDRAHNAFLDWLMAGGLPAFLLYISLFVTAIIALWTSSTLNRPERIALTAALTGYAIHNLLVFDNLYSYVYFFAILALIDSQVGRKMAFLEPAAPTAEKIKKSYGGNEEGSFDGVMAVTAAAGAMAMLIYFVNIPGINVATGLIAALSPAAGGPAENLKDFQTILATNPFAAQEVREQLVSYASTAAGNAQVPKDTKIALLQEAFTQITKQNADHPGDTRTLLELSVVYRSAGDIADAIKALKMAEALSPAKEQIYLQEGAADIDAGDTQAARAAFAKAYELGPQFPDIAAYAAAGDALVGDIAGTHDILLKAYGTTTVDNDVLVFAYNRGKDFADLIRLLQLRANKSDSTADAWFALATAYGEAGNVSAAISAVHQGVALHPDAKAQGDQVIADILKAGPAK